MSWRGNAGATELAAGRVAARPLVSVPGSFVRTTEDRAEQPVAGPARVR
jgi:hypothetical protein